MKYYLYRWIRVDVKQVFYVGFGTRRKGNCFTYAYGRALDKTKRNRCFKEVVANHPVDVEVFFETDDYNLVLEKEVEFINLYGRADLGKGSLVNLCNGGIPSKRKK